MYQAERERLRVIKEARLNLLVPCSQRNGLRLFLNFRVIEHLKAIGWEDELQRMDTTPYGPLGALQQLSPPTELTSEGEFCIGERIILSSCVCAC